MTQREFERVLLKKGEAELRRISVDENDPEFREANPAPQRTEQPGKHQHPDALDAELAFALLAQPDGSDAACPPAVWLGEEECS